MNRVPIWGLLYQHGKKPGRSVEVAIRTTSGVRSKTGNWNIQTARPALPWYFEPLDFTSPIADIVTAFEAKEWFGQKVWMWSGGYRPNTDHDREGTIVRFDHDNGVTPVTPDDSWKVKIEIPTKELGQLFHAQARDPLKSWFIIPASVFEEPTTAGLFNRIFLGR